MAKLYFQNDDSEYAFSIDYFKEYMRNNNLKEMKVFEAKIETGARFFFCREFGEVGEVGESCGTICQEYSPRNGKNGRCRHSAHVYEKGEPVLIKL